MLPKLAWTPRFIASLNNALHHSIVKHEIQNTADPLRKKLVIDLDDSLPKNSWDPLQTLAHGFAGINDCHLRAVRKERNGRRVVLDLFVKRRTGKPSNKDPFVDELNKKKRLRYMRR